MTTRPKLDPELDELGDFLAAFNHETERGAALVAASMLDQRLKEILVAFLLPSDHSKELLAGFNAPLGTFAARASAAFSLGLIQENEFKEITLIRRIRNEFGHDWKPRTFKSGAVADLSKQLPWRGPAELEEKSDLRARFNFAVSLLLVDLMWRVRLVEKEQRTPRIWPNKSRST